VEPGLGRPDRNPERGRHIVEWHPQQVVQRDDGPVPGIQAAQRLVHELAIRQGGRMIGRRRRIDGRQFDLDGPPASTAREIEAGVHRQAVQPGVEPIGIAQPGQVPPGTDEGLLDGVASELRVPKDEAGRRVEAGEPGVDELGERGLIAAPRALDELSLVHDGLTQHDLDGRVEGYGVPVTQKVHRWQNGPPAGRGTMDKPTGRSVSVAEVRAVADRREGRGVTQAERSRARREQILDAAFNTFTRRGYRDTAVDEIAAAADTSKGGVYFHFPTKEAIFRELMRTTADRLAGKVEQAVAEQTDPIAKADAALRTVLVTFAGHRTMARLLFVDAMGAGRVFNAETNALHDRFAALIAGYLDEAIVAGAIPPIDAALTGVAWFGAINEVVARWLLVDDPEPLETAYPTLRALLLRSVGVDEARIADPPRLHP